MSKKISNYTNNQSHSPNGIAATHRSTKISHSLVSQINMLRNYHFTPDEILKVYLDSQNFEYLDGHLSQNTHYSIEQGKNRSQINAMGTKPEDISYKTLLCQWKEITPPKFYSKFISCTKHPKNDSGLNDSLIYEEFIEKLKGNHKILFIDLPPSVLILLDEKKMPTHLDIHLLFSNPVLTQIFQQHTWRNNPKVTVVSEISDDVPYSYIFTCAVGVSYDETKNLLQTLCHPNKTDHDRWIVFYTHLAYLDRTKAPTDLGRIIREQFSVRQVLPIQTNHVNITPKKRCVITMQFEQQRYPLVVFERIIYDAVKITRNGRLRVPYAEFQNSRKTMNALFLEKQQAVQQAKKRKQPKVVKFSKELQLWYSVEILPKKSTGEVVFRGKFHFYDFPSEEQLRKNTLPRGSVLLSNIHGSRTDSPDKVCDCVDKLFLEHEKLSAIARDTASRHLGGEPMSLKTFWYLMLPKLSKSPRYEDSLCKNVFLNGNWNENPICSLTVGESTSDDVKQAIDQYLEMYVISHSKIKQILEQLVIIWSMYTTSHPQTENPANIVLTEISAKDSAKSKMRDALALRSLTKPQMHTFMRLLEEDTQNPVLSLVARAKSILHLSSGAAAALTIRDYFKVTNFDLKCLRITKALPATGIEPVPFRRSWQNILVPVPPMLAARLDALVEDTFSKLECMNISRKTALDYPLFPSDTVTEPLRTRTIQDYCSHMLEQLGIPEMILHNPDDDIETDIGEYHKDLLLANWKYFAAVFLGMEEDVIAYFSGRKPGTTISSHYRDFSNPFQLMQLRSYFTRMELLFSDYITTEHSSHVTLKDLNRTIRSSPQYDATELDIEFCLRDSGEQKFCINAPYGCHVEIEIIKEK